MNERYDAALLHVYGYKEEKCPPDSPERPSIRTRLVIAAARDLYRNGQTDHFVFSGEPALGKTEPMSTLAAEDFIRKTRIDPKNVLINSDADITTNQELRTLRQAAIDNGWRSLVSIGWSLHEKRINEVAAKRLWKKLSRIGAKHEVLTAEKILSDYQSPRNAARYEKVIERIHNSESEKRWEKYERRVLLISKRVPFGIEILDFVAKFYRPKAD